MEQLTNRNGNVVDCAICLSRDGYDSQASRYENRDADLFDCPVCGRFAASRNALIESLSPENPRLSRLLRAVLSHRNRLKNSRTRNIDVIMTYDVEKLIEDSPSLPSPAQQAVNAIRFIGEQIQQNFQPLGSLPASFQAFVGAPTRQYALKLVRELSDRGLLSFVDSSTLSNRYDVSQVDLTLGGWERFEGEKRGEFASNVGFIALKFGDTVLDPFVTDIIKPGIAEIGYELIDLRDVSRAGVIDNILRAQIRDAAFVIVDLTHDNSGAYWEAGYAEGLGKPVIYICERQKFDERKTHFDTNHCTTVLWSLDDGRGFIKELNATVRRSLAI